MMLAPPSPQETSLGLLVHDVARLLRRRFELRAREAKLPLSRNLCSVLVHLARDEGMSQAALAQLLDIEPIMLVRQVDRLEEAGLIERRLNPRDRRMWMLYLTPAAQPVLEQIRRLSKAVREEALIGLPEPEREALVAALRHLKSNLCNKKSPIDREPSAACATASADQALGE